MSSVNLVKGMTVTIWTTDCRETVGLFQDIIVLAQVLPAITVEAHRHKVIIPVSGITAIILPDSSILSPNLEETQEALFSKI